MPPLPYIPKDYQSTASDWLYARTEAALFSGMGLGKTAVVLDAITRLKLDDDFKGALIVAPKLVAKLTWPQEVLKWADFGWMRVADLRTAEGRHAFRHGTADIYVLNYEMLPSVAESLFKTMAKADWPVDSVVWDELTRAKNHASKRIRAFNPWRGRFKRHWGLTGTPTSEGLLSLFGQVRLLDGGARLGRHYTHYRVQWFRATDYMQYNWEPIEGSRDAIHKVISDLALVQRSEDFLNIPETVVEDIPVSLDAQARRDYGILAKEFVLGNVVAINAAVLVNKLLQLAGGFIYDESGNVVHIHSAKLEALRELSSKHETLLVVANYIHETEAILGHVPGAERWGKGSLEKWNAGKIKLLVAHPASIGYGLNMQYGGNHICWYSPTWSREFYDQSNARLARTGQEEHVVIHRLVAENTMDEAVYEVLRHKYGELNTLLEAVKLYQSGIFT